MQKEQKQLQRRRRALVREFYRGNRGFFALSMLCMAVLAGVQIALAVMMKELIDAAYGTDLAPVLRMLLAGVAGGAGLIGTDLIRAVVSPRFYKRALLQYKDNVFRRITQKSIGSFQRENTSRYLSALTNDMNSIEYNYLEPVFQLVMQLLSFVGALWLMLSYSPLLTLVSLVLCLLPLLGSVCTGGRVTDAEKHISDENEDFVGMTRDLLEGFTVVKSFRAEQEAARLFARRNEELEEARRKRKALGILVAVLASDTGAIVQVGVFVVGAYLAVSGQGVTAGMVISFVQMMNYVLNPIGAIPPMIANRRAALALVDKLADALEDNASRAGKNIPPVLQEGIAMENVGFEYEAEKPVLRDVTCTFAAGKSYAVVGASGSGKSTLLNLLLGASENYQGAIRFDGVELRDISPESLFDLVSIVQQNVFVFNDTIRNNITMFREFPEEDVQRAVRLSGLNALIAQRGEDYVCGENGKDLSGGERQRISIARCLLRSTPVMLIDEATAALDAATAFSVTREIQNLEGLTRIVVTHRLEAALLERYDAILVLRGGRIAEMGKFADLMAEKGYFYSLYTVSQD